MTIETIWREKSVRTESLLMLRKKKQKIREELKKLKKGYEFNFNFEGENKLWQ